MKLTKSDWILAILRKKPLDRIHIMKLLFLIWHRSGRNIQQYFHFEPYLYGPCSIELYSELRKLLAHGLIVQPPYPMQQWSKYYLSNEGRIKAEEAIKKFDSETIDLIEKTIEEISHLGFLDLLKKVYQEAPEFAVKSVLKGAIPK